MSHATALQDLVGPAPLARALQALCRGMEGTPMPQHILRDGTPFPRSELKDTRPGSIGSGRTRMLARS